MDNIDHNNQHLNSVEVDILSIHASAGTGIENFDIQVTGQAHIPLIFFKTKPNPKDLKLIQVVGDSMQPTLQEGDFILIDTAANAPIDGIYAIAIGTEIFIKRLQFKLDGTIKIISDNPRYETQIYDPNQNQTPLKIIGKKILTIAH